MAQRDVATFKATKNARFPDNTSGAIEEVDHRDTHEDIADSFLNITDHLIDDDTFATASATTVASSESTKAYVDAAAAGIGLLTTTVAISSAEILALFTTPKQLIAAPGAGKYIQVFHGYVFLDYGGTAYSNTSTEIQYATGHDIFTPITTFLNNGFDTLYNLSAVQNNPAAFSQFENSAVQYNAPSANPTTGNGTISINLVYRIVTI